MHDTIHDMTDRYRDRRMHSRVNNLDRQNTRLRDEVAHLRSDLVDERVQRERLQSALRDKPAVVKKRGGLLRLLIVGGAGYVMGTREGRERYDQIVNWVRSVKTKIERNADDVAAEVVAAADLQDVQRATTQSQTDQPTMSRRAQAADLGS
jgi:hypothetical protein